MELELGIGLSRTNYVDPFLKELDLISYVNYEVKQVYDDDNSTLSSQSSVINHGDEVENDGFHSVNGKKKRGFDESFEVESSVSSLNPQTLPLLLWDKEPNEQDKDPKRLCKSSSFTINKNDGEGIVGWPPIKSYRKKLCQQNDAQHHHLPCRGRNFPAVENGGACGGLRSMFVKVQMEGFLITRKIDLKLYQSYQSLTYSLLTMFGKGQDIIDSYKLTYQDREGDWLLAGDVPWRTFIRSVQRLKLIRREV